MKKNYAINKALLSLCFAFFLVTNNLSAQSDACAGTPPTLAVGVACVTTNYNVSSSFNNDGAVPCSGTSYRDGWFTFTTDATTTNVTINGTSNRNLGLAVYTACGGTQVACSVPALNNANLTAVTVAPNTTYYLRLMRTNNLGSNDMTGTICVFKVSTPTTPVNDECAAAIALPVNTSCSYLTYTNLNATASAGIPAPGCASYSGGDVWFTTTVPATGIVTVDMQTGSMLDSGLAFYSGSCGTLALLQCDDDTSINGNMSTLTQTGLVPGTTLYIRVWEYFNDNNGTFGICATTPPPCSQTPSALGTTAATGTAATISWTAATPAPVGGYEYYYSLSATPPVAPSGSVGAGITSANLTGLTTNSTYYFWVRSVCIGAERSAWVAGSFFTGHCLSNSTSAANYINAFSTSGGTLNINNTNSGYSPSGYGNFTGQAVSQNAGSAIGFTAIYYDGIFTYGFNIWVDWNNDFDFNDAGEKVFASGSYNTMNTGSFTIPGAVASGNYRMRIRADYWSTNPIPCGSITNGETEDYTLTVLPPPPCSGNPGMLSANVTSTTTATISWSAASPVPVNGYQYYYSMSTTYPNAGTIPSGTVGAGVLAANLTLLTPGQTYYFWVRSNCGGGLGQGIWIGPASFYIPLCGVGPGTGNTSLGCPSVLSGGLSLSGADPAPIDCSTAGCVDLEANYLQLGQTTDYTVESIDFIPPYQFGCLENPVSVNIDDVWSPTINLPFNFCFYGNSYNQCLMSSNGALTFDLANNTPSGSSAWSFDTNLPDAALFRNTIFGVYQDIDPSVAGNVGWELITLNTGCRALVASWQGIPMYDDAFSAFDCGTLSYTGMIVLYENTNIIEVYIQEKNVCSDWNDGNAIVGLQNAAGTQAVVAPNRNGLDADWAVTNEAWRFVPSGTAITSIKWHEGSGTLGPLIGTTDVISVCPSTTTTYTAEVTYTLCNGTTLKESDETIVTVNKTKTWNGSTGTNWNVAANWTPAGVPTALDCVEIPNVANDCIISGSGFNAYAYNLSVLNSAQLDINSANNLTVTNAVNVATGGNFNIKNSASLIQVDNVNNSGIINMERITQPMYRFDYTYWNSPLTQASGFTLGNLSPATQPDKYYSWAPSISGASGNWLQESAATVMNPQKGYIVRAPQTYSANPAIKTAYTANFIGTPNNGTISVPVSFGSLGAGATDDKWNLLGNPYPSAVRASFFLNNPANATVLDGTIYFWTHNSPPSTAFPDPFYADFVINYSASDYASWNKVGGVGTIASSGGPAPNGYIAAGEAFFVKSLAVPGNAVFNNTMRVPNYNTQFYRQSQGAPVAAVSAEELMERHRIWLNMTNNSGAFNQILVGYTEGATMDWDRGFDGLRFTNNSISFYSMIPGSKLVIQGRALPFDVSDKVPLGYNSTLEETFTIRIDHFDGLFEDQDIYLEDKQLNVIHNMKLSPYTFATTAGIFDDRFVLRYTTDQALAVNNPKSATASIFIKGKKLFARASENIQEIAIYDTMGKLVCLFNPANTSEFETLFDFADGIYLAKTRLESGVVENGKLINQ